MKKSSWTIIFKDGQNYKNKRKTRRRDHINRSEVKKEAIFLLLTKF